MFIMQLRFSYSRDIFFYFELPERYCAHVHRLKIVDTGDNEEQSGALTQKQEKDISTPVTSLLTSVPPFFSRPSRNMTALSYS